MNYQSPNHNHQQISKSAHYQITYETNKNNPFPHHHDIIYVVL